MQQLNVERESFFSVLQVSVAKGGICALTAKIFYKNIFLNNTLVILRGSPAILLAI